MVMRGVDWVQDSEALATAIRKQAANTNQHGDSCCVNCDLRQDQITIDAMSCS